MDCYCVFLVHIGLRLLPRFISFQCDTKTMQQIGYNFLHTRHSNSDILIVPSFDTLVFQLRFYFSFDFSTSQDELFVFFFSFEIIICPWKITKTRKIRENNKKYLEILSVTSCKILVKYRLTQETSIYFGFVPDKVHEISRPPSKFRCIAGRPWWPQVGIFSESLHGNETL